jgi:Ca2+-transporting ATPase
VRLLLLAGVLCNDARLQPDGEGALHAIGDPTEGALLIATARMGIDDKALLAALPRVEELPFDSERKRMTTVHTLDVAALPVPAALQAPYLAVSRGAVDGLLDVATHILSNGAPEPMTAAWRARVEQANANLARGGMRVLGFAVRPLQQAMVSPLEEQLTFVGLVGMIDPRAPRCATPWPAVLAQAFVRS